MSIRKAQLQREPAGRLVAGGSGAEGAAERAVAGTGASTLCKFQLAGLDIVIKNLRVAAPLDRGFKLAGGFQLAEVLVKQIAEELFAERAVRFGFECLFHLAEKRHVSKSCFAKDSFARLNVGLCKSMAFRSDDDVALFDAEQPEQHR